MSKEAEEFLKDMGHNELNHIPNEILIKLLNDYHFSQLAQANEDSYSIYPEDIRSDLKDKEIDLHRFILAHKALTQSEAQNAKLKSENERLGKELQKCNLYADELKEKNSNLTDRINYFERKEYKRKFH